jgi:hypothetical protein
MGVSASGQELWALLLGSVGGGDRAREGGRERKKDGGEEGKASREVEID